MIPEETRVRHAGTGDIRFLVEARAEMFSSMGVVDQVMAWREAAADWFENHLDDESVGVFIAEREGKAASCAVGVLHACIPGPDVDGLLNVEISNVYTSEWARGSGCARAVMTALLNWARDRGAVRAKLNATDQGQPLYTSLGFVMTRCPAMKRSL